MSRNVYAEVIYEDLPAAITSLAGAFGFTPGRTARNAEGHLWTFGTYQVSAE